MREPVGIISVFVWVVLVSASLAAGPAQGQEPVLGSWGGEHIQLTASFDIASVELDCADGEIAEPILPDPDGRFLVNGSFALGHGGPVVWGEVLDQQAALYAGSVQDNLMELMITVQDTGEEIGPFVLMKDNPANLFQCLWKIEIHTFRTERYRVASNFLSATTC